MIGQNEAVSAVANAVRRSRAGISDPDRPNGSFLFLGPTGVGKTELCKTLARFLFDTEDALVRIDMSEFMEKHSVARLIGAPPGYVGFDQGGLLTDSIDQHPHCVLLLDEIEKAHPDVMNLLLQILEEGMITDSFGRKVDFRNTIIIMTSNVGAQTIKRQTSLGFGAMSEDNADFEGMKEKIMEEAKKEYKPEFLNRLDDLVVFKMLEKESLSAIVDLEIGKLLVRLREKEIDLELNTSARDFLIVEGYDPNFGARPMRRAVERHLEDPLAEALLRSEFKAGDMVDVSHEEGAKELSFEVRPSSQAAPDEAEVTG